MGDILLECIDRRLLIDDCLDTQKTEVVVEA